MTAGKRARTRSSVVLGDPQSVRHDPSAKSLAYFCLSEPIRFDQPLLAELKDLAAQRGDVNVRLCLHDRPEAAFHEMIILEHAGKYYRPHKHLAKGESYHIIEGSMAVFVFNDQGVVDDAVRLSPFDTLVYRIGSKMYHAVMPLSKTVIYHESKPGPFVRESDCEYPAWAPDGQDPTAVAVYTGILREALDRHAGPRSVQSV